MDSLIFISCKKDSRHVINLVKKIGPGKLKVISNSPPASRLLAENGIAVTDSQAYFPIQGTSLADFRKLTQESLILSRLEPMKSQLLHNQHQLGNILNYSLGVYLAEVKHSLLTAAEIIRREKPRTIFLSTAFTESPMKTYQSGNLNCENVALAELAKNMGIQIVLIDQPGINDHAVTLKIVGRQLLGSLLYSLKQLAATDKKLSVPPLIFLANHYQLGNLIPAIKLFMKNKFPLLVVGKVSDPLLQTIIGNKIPFVNYSSQLPIKTNFKYLKLILTLKYIFMWFRHQAVLRQEFSRNGYYWPLIKLKLFYYYLVLIPQIIETLNFADSLFDQHPKVMLTTATNDVFSKCFALSAKQHGTTVVEIQHGLLLLDVDAPFRCNDIYAVWGKDVVPLLDQTPTSQNPKIVGYPYAVDVPSRGKQKQLSALGRQKVGISSTEKVILVLGAFPVTVNRFFSPVSTLGFINMLIKGTNDTRQPWTIIIRPHPSYIPRWIPTLPTPKSIKLILDPGQLPLNEAVAASDIVIANHTTTILETLIQNKPLLLYLFLQPAIQELKSHPLIVSGVAPLFHTAKELTDLLNKISTDNSFVSKKSIDRFLTGYFSLPTKLTAAERLNRLCQQYLA